MTSYNFIALIKLILMFMVVANAPTTEGTMTCGMVASKVSACLGYLRGPGGPVPAACCNNARALNDAAKTTPDRQQACKCLKSIATVIPGINYGVAEGLPNKRGINFPYKLSLATDCNRVY